MFVLVGCSDCGSSARDGCDGPCPCEVDSDCAGTEACFDVFSREDETTFTQVARLTSPSPMAGGRFGASVAISDGRILVGEDGERTDPDLPGTAWLAGAAYVRE